MSLPDSPAPRRRWRLNVREHLRGYFIAGILVTGPTALTVYLIWLFVTFIDHSVGALLPSEYNPQTYLHVPGIGLVIVVVGLTLIGGLTAGVLGRVYIRMTDRILARMPVVRGIYAAVKQIFETVLGDMPVESEPGNEQLEDALRHGVAGEQPPRPERQHVFH